MASGQAEAALHDGFRWLVEQRREFGLQLRGVLEAAVGRQVLLLPTTSFTDTVLTSAARSVIASGARY